MSNYTLKIIHPKGVYYEGQVEICNVVTTDGRFGILGNMLPFAGVLEIAEMNFIEKGERKYYFVSGGFIYVKKDEVTIITDAIESKEEIDLARAQAAKERAQKRLQSKADNIDLLRAELALKRAITRIRVKSN